MAVTQTTGQMEVDAETARNAADILSIIADYENEVDTVVGESEEQTGAYPSREPLGQSQPAALVPAKEPPQQTPTAQLDTQADILRGQLDRAKKLQEDAAAAISEAQAEEAVTHFEPIYQAPVRPQIKTEQGHSPSQDLPPVKAQPARIETTTAASSQQGYEAFTHILEDIRSELRIATEQRHTFVQQLTASQKRIAHLEQTAESTPRRSPSSATVSTMPEPVVSPIGKPTSVAENTDNPILMQILAAQSSLAQEIKAIKDNSANPLHPEGTPFEATPQPEPCTLDTLAAELTLVKSHLHQLEYGSTHLANPMGGYTKPIHTPAFHDTGITQHIQDLRAQLEQTYGERGTLEQTLTQANQTMQCLQERIRQQEKALAEKSQQLNALHLQRESETTHLHTQLADQADALNQANHALHKEISQRREVEHMLTEISSQFQLGRY